jgi:hypothetical protein
VSIRHVGGSDGIQLRNGSYFREEGAHITRVGREPPCDVRGGTVVIGDGAKSDAWWGNECGGLVRTVTGREAGGGVLYRRGKWWERWGGGRGRCGRLCAPDKAIGVTEEGGGE